MHGHQIHHRCSSNERGPMVTTKGLTTMRAREKRKVRLPQAVFVLLVFLGFLQARNFATAMPDVMATHFGASGAANGWQTKDQFFVRRIRTARRLPLDQLSAFPPSSQRATIADQFAEQGILAGARPPRSHPSRLPHPDGLVRLRPDDLSDRSQPASLQRQPIVPRHLNGAQFTIALVAFLGFVALWAVRLVGYFSRSPS